MTRNQVTDYLMDSGYSREDANFEAICRTGIDIDDNTDEPKTGKFYRANLIYARNMAESEK